MNKLFLNRSVHPSETVAKQKEYLDKIGLTYDLDIFQSPDGYCWVSETNIHGIEPYSRCSTPVRGKGILKDECIASNLGELIERFSWDLWLEEAKKDFNKTIELKNLKTGNYDKFNVGNIYQNFIAADFMASGNNREEAVFHTLTEMLEMGGGKGERNTYPTFFEEVSILDTKNLNIPDMYKNLQFVIERDIRIPEFYNLIVVRPMNEGFLPDFVREDDGIITFQNIQSEPLSSGASKPPPPIFGQRSGLDLEKLIPSAINELIQNIFVYNRQHNMSFPYDVPAIEKNYPKYLNLKTIEDFPNNESSSIEVDNNFLLEKLFDLDFNIWEMDVSLPESPIKTIKLLNDYNLSGDNVFGERFFSMFFKIRSGVDV